MEVHFIVTYDREVGWWSFVPKTAEAHAWLLEELGIKGTIDGLNEEGAKDWARRARKDGFRVQEGGAS